MVELSALSLGRPRSPGRFELPAELYARFVGPEAQATRVQVLRTLRLLSNLSEQSRDRAVALIDERALIEFYPRGEQLILEGADDSDVYFILRGATEVYVGRQRVACRGPGDHVGEMAAMDATACRSATVVVADDALVARVKASSFRDLLQLEAGLGLQLANIASARLRERGRFHPKRNERLVVFIGSSSEQSAVAELVAKGLEEHGFESRMWNGGRVFIPSVSSMESLMSLASTADFAVLILAPDDITITRDRERPVPRGNVLLEWGLFAGRLGPRRSLGVRPRTSVSLPSDLDGLSMIMYDPPGAGETFDPTETCNAIARAVRLCMHDGV